jgi:hypothetical protein
MQASIDIESEKHIRRIQLWNTISISLFPLEANDDLHKKKKKGGRKSYKISQLQPVKKWTETCIYFPEADFRLLLMPTYVKQHLCVLISVIDFWIFTGKGN